MKSILTFGLLAIAAILPSCKKGDLLNPIKLEPQVNIPTIPHDSTYYVYPTGYTAANAILQPINLGVPAYLESKVDDVDQNFIFKINNTLPDGKSLIVTHPKYLLPTAVNTINIKTLSDIYITFVSSNGGFKNTLAYYTYKTDNPPIAGSGGSDNRAMDKITYIFPNANALGNDGGLTIGNTYKIGSISPRTSIGFVLIIGGWNGYYTGPQKLTYYTQDNLNPETVDNLKRHSILLYDKESDKYIMGFERINRQNNSDQDFNDAVFYIKSNKANSISNNNVAILN